MAFTLDTKKIEEAVLKATTDHFAKKVQHLRCPIHHRGATVVGSGTDWKVNGCCEEFMKTVTAELKK